MPYTLYNNNNSMDEICNFRDIEISQRISGRNTSIEIDHRKPNR